MQGLHDFVPTEQKIRYINALLKVGFHTIDFGSFVSPKAIPQMRDTAEVLASLEWQQSSSRLLAIIANVRGAEEALQHSAIDYLGFPLSASETFQQRNTNKSIAEALQQVKEIQQRCEEAKKQLVVYISMGFGNPYGDPYDASIAETMAQQLSDMGVSIISLADTVGSADVPTIDYLFKALTQRLSHIEIGAHFHAVPQQAAAKVQAAYLAGCRRFDGAIGGMGGCPMAKDELTGNTPTETMIATLSSYESLGLNMQAFADACRIKTEIFG
jgi:hydroxymethylglutaryl-CoA lyase